MTYVGHEQVVRIIREVDARVNLLMGPESIGKWTLGEHFAREWGVGAADLLRVNRLTADNSRMIERFALAAPNGSRRVVIARLKDASKVSFNILLKTLEEAPETSFFFLCAEERPPATIWNRCQVFYLAPLKDEDVEQVLARVKRFNPDVAKDLSIISRGQVKTALTMTDTKERKMLVLRALEAFRAKDASILEGLASRWTEEHTELLTILCQEAVTGRWRLFSDDEVGLQGNKIPLKILMALRAEVRPRLTIRSSLMNALLGER